MNKVPSLHTFSYLYKYLIDPRNPNEIQRHHSLLKSFQYLCSLVGQKCTGLLIISAIFPVTIRQYFNYLLII